MVSWRSDSLAGSVIASAEVGVRSQPPGPGGASFVGVSAQLAMLAAAAAAAVAGLSSWWAWSDALLHHLPIGFAAVMAGLWIALGLSLCAAVACQRDSARGRARGAGVGTQARVFGACLALTAIVYLALFPTYRSVYADAAVGLGGGLFSAFLLLARNPGATRWVAAVDRAAIALLSAVVVGEGGLRLYASLVPTSILASTTSGAAELLAAMRYDQGYVHHGFPTNSRGDYDREPPTRPERLIVVIGDSFSFGVVPLPLHFTSVCEDAMGEGVEVYNMGAPGIGPPEYLLLLDEALAMEPEIVVVNVFVGNDLVFDPPEAQGEGWLRPILDRGRVRVVRLVERGLRLRALRRERAAIPVEPDAAARKELAERALNDPRHTDPFQEPTFEWKRFFDMELSRAEDVCDENASEELAVFEYLDRMISRAGEVPLHFAVIPDEFQVEDGLWNAIVTASGARLDRQRPQRLLRDWFEVRDAEFLDYLPILRAEPELEDGDRHLYLSRDTHWNARGNAVAGRALATWLEPRSASAQDDPD